MNRNALIVPQTEIDTVWNAASGFIDSALRHSNGEIDVQTVYDLLKEGRMQLWIVHIDDGTIVAAAVTELIEYPLKKVCRIVALGGSGMGQWVEVIAGAAEAWARSTGCHLMDTMCRSGFEKAISHLGYSKSYIHMGKVL